MPLASKIKLFLKKSDVNFVHYVDTSQLSAEQNKGFHTAILFGIVLSPNYLKQVFETPAYIEKMKREKQIQNDEFHLTELKTDRIADELSNYLTENGFEAYSQSEANIEKTGYYDIENHITPLPHKTIALMAGIGWIGKHNLLVTQDFGSGISMCSVLTNAPLKTVNEKPTDPKCGNCTICVNTCRTHALTGNNWEIGKTRENIIDVKKCTPCYECVVHCPWTQRYIDFNVNS